MITFVNPDAKGTVNYLLPTAVMLGYHFLTPKLQKDATLMTRVRYLMDLCLLGVGTSFACLMYGGRELGAPALNVKTEVT